MSKKILFALLCAVSACATNGGNQMGGDDDGDVPFTNGTSTLAGSGDVGYIDGARAVARFSNPVNVAVRNGQVYVADFDNNKLRVIDANSHETSTVIAQKGFARPFGLAFAGDGTLFVSTDNDMNGGHTAMSGSIWKVDLGARTVAILANAIGRPRGIAVMPNGKIAAADYEHHVIELVDPTSGQVTPLAGVWDSKGMVDGPGATARFAQPYGIVVKDGKIVVADWENNRLRVVAADGTTQTFAGTGVSGFADGTMDSAMFSHPQGVALAGNGDMFVTDIDNFRIRRISGQTVATVAGDGKGGWVDNDDPLASELFGLEGLAVTSDGSMLYVADGNRGESTPHNYVRQVKLH